MFCSLASGFGKGGVGEGLGMRWGGLGEGLRRGWGWVGEGLGRALPSILERPRLKNPINVS